MRQSFQVPETEWHWGATYHLLYGGDVLRVTIETWENFVDAKHFSRLVGNVTEHEWATFMYFMLTECNRRDNLEDLEKEFFCTINQPQETDNV